MFHSATLKLTAWYLAIIMVISLVFSFSIYQINFHEVNVRLENLQNGFNGMNNPNTLSNQSMNSMAGTPIDILRQAQSNQAASQMILSLFYINSIILIGGGFGSYFLARRTLRPIEQAHEAQSRFTSDASHELRTPLAAIKAEIEVTLRDKKIDPHEARELLESNLEEVDKLIGLSEMLLNLSRLDYDRLEKKTIDVTELLESTMKSFSKSRKRFDITTRKKVRTIGDKAALSELMTILIENALKYSPANSTISIRLFERLNRVGFEIINIGTIEDKHIPHIFDRFYRGDTSRTKSSENGYGLGLALAKKIVDIHGGDISVSQKGDTVIFTFYLPTISMLTAKDQ